jgi:hypothetical protein
MSVSSSASRILAIVNPYQRDAHRAAAYRPKRSAARLGIIRRVASKFRVNLPASDTF